MKYLDFRVNSTHRRGVEKMLLEGSAKLVPREAGEH